MYLRKYWTVLTSQLKNAIAYRGELAVYFLADLMTPLLMMIAWLAVFSAQGKVGSFDRDTMLTYYLLIFVLRTVLSVYPHEVSRYIKSGELNKFLLRPIGIISYQLLGEVAWKIGRILFITIAVIGMVKIFFPNGLPTLELFTPALYLALTIAFLLNYFSKIVIELLAFWLVEVVGLRISFFTLESFFAGTLLPLSIMPPLLQTIALFFPFRFFYYFPVQIILGQLSDTQILTGLLTGLVWLGSSIAAARFLFYRGLRKYSAVSG